MSPGSVGVPSTPPSLTMIESVHLLGMVGRNGVLTGDPRPVPVPLTYGCTGFRPGHGRGNLGARGPGGEKSWPSSEIRNE